MCPQGTDMLNVKLGDLQRSPVYFRSVSRSPSSLLSVLSLEGHYIILFRQKKKSQ